MIKNRKKKICLAAITGFATFAAYLPALGNDFVWDDIKYIVENAHIRSLNALFFNWALFDFYASNWHPLTWLSHSLDYLFWGLNPAGHHLTNNLLHALNTAIVTAVAIRLLNAAKEGASREQSAVLNEQGVFIAAGVTGLLFGLHPLHVESAAWISERKDLLCALFFLLSLASYIQYAGRGDGSEGIGWNCENQERMPLSAAFANRSYLTALTLFVLALMSKPMAVTLPAVFLILDWYPFGRLRGFQTVRALLGEKLPFFLLSLASSIVSIFAQKSGRAIAPTDVLSLWDRIVQASGSLVGYLTKMAAPLHLVPYYPYREQVPAFSVQFLVTTGLLAAVSAVCLASIKKRKWMLSAWSYYIVTLLPVLGIIQVGHQAMADRYAYLPSLAPFLLCGLAAAWLTEKINGAHWKKFFLSLLLSAVFLPMLLLTFAQIAIWRNGLVFWNFILQNEPRVDFAHNNRGAVFEQMHQFDLALADYTMAIKLNPSKFEAYNNRGVVYERMGEFGNALADYDATIRLKPDNPDAYNNRGVLYDSMGRTDKAIVDFNAAIALDPSYPMPYVNRAGVFEKIDQGAEALKDYDRAITLDPLNGDAYMKRGLLRGKKDMLDQAVEDFSRSLALNPANADAYANRGTVYALRGRYDAALEEYRKAMELDRENPLLYFNRGRIYLKTGQREQADADFRNACNRGNGPSCDMLKQH